jgi:hypothetical protein
MPMTERCGMCAKYTPIEGIFGDCSEKNDTAFSADPKCGAFAPNPKGIVNSAAPSFADFGSRHLVDPGMLAFMGMGLPPGFMPQHKCAHQQQETEPEKTEWKSPLFRRKRKARKVINLAEAIAERKNRCQT